MKTVIVTSVRSYIGKNDKPMVCINGSIHVSQKQLDGLGYRQAIALQGETINVEYYAAGDTMLNGAQCTKADTIVKSFNVSISEADLKLAKAANFGLIVKL